MAGKYWMVMAAGTLALLADDAQAAVSGQIHARLILIAGCEVTNTSNPASPVSDLGTLDFGQQGPTWDTPIKAALDGDTSGKLNVACNPSVTGFTVTIDGGTHGDGNTRRLSNGRQTLPYQLFLDPRARRATASANNTISLSPALRKYPFRYLARWWRIPARFRQGSTPTP